MKKIIFIMAVVCFGMVGPTQAKIVDLVAGQNLVVGTVEVTKIAEGEDAGDLLVKYLIDTECEGVLLLETHLHIGKTLGDFPITKKSGAPKIGQFDYSTDHDPAVGEHTYQIPAEDLPTESFIVAAHAVTGNDCCEICASADLLIEVSATFDCCGINGESFFEVIITDGTNCIAQETYLGWCADIDHSLSRSEVDFYDHETELDLKVYSTCSDEPMPAEILGDYGESGGIMYPENLDLVNWIMNNVSAGQDIIEINDQTTCSGFITYGEIQGAIWVLLEGATYAEIIAQSGIGTVDKCRMDEIVQAAQTYGVGFKPGCCEVVAVILAPIPLPPEGSDTPDIETRQLILIPVPAPCCETAWGDGQYGLPFTDSTWATYFWFPQDPE